MMIKSVFSGKNKKILDEKLWAISKALGTVIQKTSAIKNTLIKIFSNSQKALPAI